MKKTIALLKEQLIGIRSGRLSAAVVATVKVDYHGQATPLQHISSIIEQGRRICIAPYDRGSIDSIQRTLKKCGFSSHKFSKQEIVVNVPMVSGEEKEKIFVRIRKLGEEAKVSIRNIRKKHRHRLTGDERKEQDKEIDKEYRLAVNEIDQIINDRIGSLRAT